MDVSGGGLRESNIFGLFKIYGNVSSLDEAEIVCVTETDDSKPEEYQDRVELVKKICQNHLILVRGKRQEAEWQPYQFKVRCWDHSDFDRKLNDLIKGFQPVFALQESLKANQVQFLTEKCQFEELMGFAPKRHRGQKEQIRAALESGKTPVSDLMNIIHDKHVRQVRKLHTTYLSEQKDSLVHEIQAGIQSHSKVIVLLKEEYILSNLCSPLLRRVNVQKVQEDLFKNHRFVVISHMNSQMTTTHMPNLWNGFLKKEENSDSDEESGSAVMLAPNPTTESEQFLFGFDEA